MTTYFKNLLVLVLATCITSCQKKDNTPADLSKVNVTFSQPAFGQVYHSGDTVQVNADITYASEILSVGIQITDTATGEVLFEEDHDLHTDHFVFPAEWVDTLTDSAGLQVRVSVFVANGTTAAERSIYIRSQP